MSTTFSEIKAGVTSFEHAKKVTDVKERIRQSLMASGNVCDVDVKTVNGQYIGLFVLPSLSHLYVGFGPLGGNQAFQGAEADFDAGRAASAISKYVAASTASNLSQNAESICTKRT